MYISCDAKQLRSINFPELDSRIIYYQESKIGGGGQANVIQVMLHLKK